MNQKQEQEQELKFIKKNTNLINKLRSNGLDFNDLFILECFYYKEDREFLKMYTIPSLHDITLSVRYQALQKNEYLVEDPDNINELKISVKGENFYLECFKEELPETTIIVADSKTPDKCFEEWWKTYPNSTGWKTDDGNTVFTGSRSLKNIIKSEAKKKYLKILNQGIRHEDLIGSLLYEMKIKKLDSIKKGQNQMEFFKGVGTYLNQESYLGFIDAYKENPSFIQSEKIKGKKKNVTDI